MSADSPSISRRIVREEFEGRFPQASVQVAELVCSELVTNAVKYGVRPLILTVHDGDGYLHVEVADGGHAFVPRIGPAAPGEGELGLELVGSLADAWGIESTEGGVLVWAKISPGRSI